MEKTERYFGKGYITCSLLSNDGFYFDVFVHGLLSPFTPVSGLFETTKGRLQIKIATLDDPLAEAIVDSGQKTHERIWRLPLPEDYKELLKSEFADTNNMSSTRWGGAITAALFLSGFTEGTRWAHIDIAGPAYQKKGAAYCDAGGTGFGVRLFCDLIDRLK